MLVLSINSDMLYDILLCLDSYLLQISHKTTTSMACKPETLYFGCYLPPWQAWTWQLPPGGLWCTCGCPWACQWIRGLHTWERAGASTCPLPSHVCAIITPSAAVPTRVCWHTQISYKEVACLRLGAWWRKCSHIKPMRIWQLNELSALPSYLLILRVYNLMFYWRKLIRASCKWE